VKVEMVVVGWELEFVGVDDSETKYRSMVRVNIRTGPVGFSDDNSVDLELEKTNREERLRIEASCVPFRRSNVLK